MSEPTKTKWMTMEDLGKLQWGVTIPVRGDGSPQSHALNQEQITGAAVFATAARLEDVQGELAVLNRNVWGILQKLKEKTEEPKGSDPVTERKDRERASRERAMAAWNAARVAAGLEEVEYEDEKEADDSLFCPGIFSGRARSAFRELGISTFDELVLLTESQVKDTKNVGVTTTNEIKARLAERDLELKKEDR